MDTLEKCLSGQPKDTTRYDEAMNVKLLLREVTQFIGNKVSQHISSQERLCGQTRSYMNITLTYQSGGFVLLDLPPESPQVIQVRALASRVLYALSVNNFNAVFNRVSGRLQELSTTNEENPDYTDIDLIQHISLDLVRLNKLLNGTCHFLSDNYYHHCEV